MDRRIPLPPARRLGGVLLALALSAALAAPAHAAQRSDDSFFGPVWRLLSSLWDEIGTVFDPNGRSQPSALFGQTGLEFDPGGLTAPTPPTSNTGHEANPNG